MHRGVLLCFTDVSGPPHPLGGAPSWCPAPLPPHGSREPGQSLICICDTRWPSIPCRSDGTAWGTAPVCRRGPRSATHPLVHRRRGIRATSALLVHVGLQRLRVPHPLDVVDLHGRYWGRHRAHEQRPSELRQWHVDLTSGLHLQFHPPQAQAGMRGRGGLDPSAVLSGHLLVSRIAGLSESMPQRVPGAEPVGLVEKGIGRMDPNSGCAGRSRGGP